MNLPTPDFPTAYTAEQARLRELIDAYLGLPNQAGWFGAAAITRVLERADAASATHDTAAMIYCYQRMKACS